jgi:hypothetical protein
MSSEGWSAEAVAYYFKLDVDENGVVDTRKIPNYLKMLFVLGVVSKRASPHA